MDFDVVLVDDHSLVLEGLKSLLKEVPGIGNVYAATSGKELLDMLKTHTPSLYIMDLELPDADGFALAADIKRMNPVARIIVCTMHEEVWIVKQLKHPDIDAVVFKSSGTLPLLEAVHALMAGETYYCPRFRQLYKETGKAEGDADSADILPTSRELDILKAMAKGMNTHEISQHLFISENTVEWHRKNLMLKFSARNATDLVIKALAKGFLTIPL